jgi:ABC-2 type transport system ATP-binding protein
LVDITRAAPKVVRLFGADAKLQKKLAELETVADIVTRDHVASFRYKGDVNLLLKFLSAYKLKDVSIQEPALEEIFMKYYEADGA